MGRIRSRIPQRTVGFSFNLNVVGAAQPECLKFLAPPVFEKFAKMSDKNKARVPVGEEELLLAHIPAFSELVLVLRATDS
ncbi:hypothetical protein H671_5g15106 [Cricetulus griseus]|nr:hypothetical protein H671_5g15106 [Cricetulus griseus]